MTEKAVVLLSGGMDSATCLYEARAAGYDLYALTVNYGQRARREIQAAQEVARDASVIQHHVYPLDLRLWGGSALTDNAIDIPTSGLEDDIPVTYVPARNTILLSLALGWAEVLEASAIYIGVNDIDYSGYPDCRPEFIAAFQQVVMKCPLIIIDELGFLPFSQQGAHMLFSFISQRYQRGSLILTTNLAFSDWTQVFGDERLLGALLDRLTYHLSLSLFLVLTSTRTTKRSSKEDS